MATEDLFTVDGDDAVVLSVHAQAGAGRTHVMGRHGDALKIRVAAPPEQGRANEALVAVLAEQLGVPEKAVTLTSGPASRSKRFRISGVDPAEFAETLELVLGTEDGAKRKGRGRR